MEKEELGPIPNTGMWAATPAIVYEDIAYFANWAWEDFCLEILENKNTVVATDMKLTQGGRYYKHQRAFKEWEWTVIDSQEKKPKKKWWKKFWPF